MITFYELTLIFLFVFFVSLIFRILKQPLIVGYILTGILLSGLFFKFLETKSVLEIFSELGISFLLFIVGLEIKLKTLRDIGLSSIIIGFLQEVFTILGGFLISYFILGFNFVTSLYLSIALSFSSTIIILKLIADKGDLEKLYGKLAIGFLLVQDLIAIVILFLLPFLKTGFDFLIQENFLNIVLGIAALIFIPFFFNRFFPKIENFLEKSQEFLFLFSITFGLGISSLFKFLGFGLESGALIAGIILSELASSYEIVGRLRPLRDFFLVLFFIFLGSEILISDFQNLIYPAIILSLFIIIGNPLIMLLFLLPLGYSFRTSFLLGLTSAQISEFSFILINQGVKLGHLDKNLISLIGIVGFISIFFSTYVFYYSERIYNLFYPLFRILERKKTKTENEKTKLYEYFLFGCDRIGYTLLNFFEDKKKESLIVDYNPEIIFKLKEQGFNVIYGDVDDIYFLEEINFCQAKLIISTIPDYFSNILLLKTIKKQNSEVIVIVTANRIDDALDLYHQGADFVILPHFLGGEYVLHIIKENHFDQEKYKFLKEKELRHLQHRKFLGHKHPAKFI